MNKKTNIVSINSDDIEKAAYGIKTINKIILEIEIARSSGEPYSEIDNGNVLGGLLAASDALAESIESKTEIINEQT